MDKRELRRAAARLRGLKGWAHGGASAGGDVPAVEVARQALRSEEVYAEGGAAAACAACAAARQAAADETALCERHLAEAMGL